MGSLHGIESESEAGHMGENGAEIDAGGKKSLRHSTDRRVVRTRKAIRDAFFRLMGEQDYHKITIASIAREADIDRKTFYLHYDSVSSLVDEIVLDEARVMVDGCREAFAGGDRSFDVSKLFRSISDALASDAAASKRVVEHISMQDILDRMEASLVEVLMEDNPLGISHDDPYLPYIVSFFCAGLISVYRRWMIGESNISLENLASATSVCMFDGLNGVLASAGVGK